MSLPLAAAQIFGGYGSDEPSESPSAVPSDLPTKTCNIECKTDYGTFWWVNGHWGVRLSSCYIWALLLQLDCPRVCKKDIYQQFGTCIGPTSIPTTFPTERSSSQKPTSKCPCDIPKKIPDKCEVDILIDLIEVEVLAQPKLSPQWLRAAFHDAGTFDQTMPEGGANGCLLNHPPMRWVDIARMFYNTTTLL